MTFPVVRQAQYALTAGVGALVLIETSALAKAHELTFEGSWLIAAGAVIFAAIALWLTCMGALQSDRGMRDQPTSGGDRSGPVYSDIDGNFHVH